MGQDAYRAWFCRPPETDYAKLLDKKWIVGAYEHFTEISVELETVYSDPNVAAFRMASKTFGYL